MDGSVLAVGLFSTEGDDALEAGVVIEVMVMSDMAFLLVREGNFTCVRG